MLSYIIRKLGLASKISRITAGVLHYLNVATGTCRDPDNDYQAFFIHECAIQNFSGAEKEKSGLQNGRRVQI
jgi:hypothetical protein